MTTHPLVRLHRAGGEISVRITKHERQPIMATTQENKTKLDQDFARIREVISSLQANPLLQRAKAEEAHRVRAWLGQFSNLAHDLGRVDLTRTQEEG